MPCISESGILSQGIYLQPFDTLKHIGFPCGWSMRPKRESLCCSHRPRFCQTSPDLIGVAWQQQIGMLLSEFCSQVRQMASALYCSLPGNIASYDTRVKGFSNTIFYCDEGYHLYQRPQFHSLGLYQEQKAISITSADAAYSLDHLTFVQRLVAMFENSNATSQSFAIK